MKVRFFPEKKTNDSFSQTKLKGNYHLSNFSRIEYFEFYKSTGACPTRTQFPKHEIWISDFRLIRESRKCKQNTLIFIFMMAAALIGDVYNPYYEKK